MNVLREWGRACFFGEKTGLKMSWVWLEGIDSLVKGERVSAWKVWEDSFPLPYLIEMIAQAGAILLGAESHFEKDIVFTKIQEVQFLGRPKAGRRLVIEVEVQGLRSEGGWFYGEIFQEGLKILQGEVLLMNVGRLRPDGEGPITFPENLIAALK